MLHFDSHADLACPNASIPAGACFQPRRNWQSVEKSSEGTVTCTNKDLYELLDSTTSGIAEWILPLVLGASLTRVHWIRPRHTPNGYYSDSVDQLPLGTKTFHVGAWNDVDTRKTVQVESFLDLPDTAVVKTDWDCLYYRDEDVDSSFAPTDALVLRRPLHLQVSELGDAIFPTASSQSSLEHEKKQHKQR